MTRILHRSRKMHVLKTIAVVACLVQSAWALPAFAVMTADQCKTIYAGTCNTISPTCDPGLINVGDCDGYLINTPCCGRVGITPGTSAATTDSCQKGPGGCCITTDAVGEPGPNNRMTGSIRKETCADGSKIYYADCYCSGSNGETGPYPNPMSYAACTAQCQTDGVTILNTKGVGLFKPPEGQTGGNASTEQFVNALCFTLDQCATSDYGGSSSAFVPDSQCPTGQGKCLAPEPSITLSSPVLGVTSIAGFPRYVVLMFQYMLAIVVITAAVMFVYAGFKYIVGSSAGDIGSAKETMTNAVVGLFLSFAAYTLLNTLNPALTNYSRLNVYLINKLEFSNLEWCSDYKLKSGKQFADAGDPAGSTAYSAATFTVTPDQTLCGKSYYPDGFNGKTCKGQACTEKGEICVACDKGGCPAGATAISACVKATIAGSIAVSDGRVPSDVYLLGICNGIDPPSDSGKVASAVPYSKAMQLSSGSAGATFKFVGSSSDLKEMTDACKNQGGLRGAVFGVKYKDTGKVLAGAVSGAINAATNSEDCGSGFLGTLCTAQHVVYDAVTGGASNIVTLDDVAIVSKGSCGGGSSVFSGYADGTGSTVGNMQTAIYCGYRVTPGTATGRVFATGNTGAFNAGAVFTADDLQKAFSSDGQAIQCNFGLNDTSAPSDPGTNYEAGCTSGWSPI